MPVSLSDLNAIIDRQGETAAAVSAPSFGSAEPTAEELELLSAEPKAVISGDRVTLVLKRNQLGNQGKKGHTANTGVTEAKGGNAAGSWGYVTVEGQPQYKWIFLEDADRGATTLDACNTAKKEWLTYISIAYSAISKPEGWTFPLYGSIKAEKAQAGTVNDKGKADASFIWYGVYDSMRAAGSDKPTIIPGNGADHKGWQGVRFHPGRDGRESEGCLVIHKPGTVDLKQGSNTTTPPTFYEGPKNRSIPAYKTAIAGTMDLYSFLIPQYKAGKKVYMKILKA